MSVPVDLWNRTTDICGTRRDKSGEILANRCTNKVEHHLGRVVWCGSDAQQLLPFGYSRVVDSLYVDVVTRHHDVTDPCVFFCISHL